MDCPQCRHANPSGTKFCGECGARLQSLCPACKTANAPANKFCSECGQPLTSAAPSPAPAATAAPEAASRFASPEAYTPKHLAAKILTSRGAIEGERKIVTVMFSDVSGFTAISEKLDPEDVHAIMDRAFELILEAVHRYEGTVNQFLGDGVMALFGAPIAHEDHAQRALSAALAIQEGLKPLAEEVSRAFAIDFRMRMGINTGPVVVGAIGQDLRMDYTAVGDTTNVAARLLAIAQPGQIVTSRRTQNLRSHLFAFEDLGEFQVKGKAEPIRAYAVSGELSRQARLEVSRQRELTPLAGREPELRRLAEIHRRATARQGAIAVIMGDAGVGKSRLLYEFLHRLEAEAVRVLEATCASYGRSMAFRPVVDLLRSYLGLFEGIAADEIRARIAERHEFLGLEGEERQILLAHFLGASAPADFLGRLSAAQVKERTFEAVRDVFLHASELQAFVLVVENMHWIDTASEEFLAHLVKHLPGHRVLLVLTARPGYAAPWLPAPLAETVTLEGLGAADVAGMARTLLAVEGVSAPLFTFLADRSEGNPLYVEEILRQLQETDGLTVEDGQARLSRADVTVPATIHDIIAARVDRLSDALKQTLQGAAVIGRRFGVSLVSRVLKLAREDVTAHLNELHGLDFVFPSASTPEPMYSFKHALTQDVVYGGVLERRRRAYHTEAGLGLEELFSSALDDVVELVAYHFRRGQVWDKASTYLRRAAVKAQARSAHREAQAALEDALETLRHLPETPETREQEIDVRIDLRGSLYPLGEFEKLLGYLREAEVMAGAISDFRRLGWVSIHTAEYFRQTGKFAEARALAEQALAQGDKLENLPLRVHANHYLGLACHALGDYRRACDALRTVARSPQPEWRSLAFGGTVTGSWAAYQAVNFAWLARCLAERGEFEEGMTAGRQAVTLAESPYSQAVASLGLGYISLVRGDVDTASAVLERACTITREGNFALLRPQASRFLGGAYLLAGRIAEGCALVQAAADEVESRRLAMQQASVLGSLGEAYLYADRLHEAVTVAERALSIARERGQRGDEATALYLLGETAARDTHPAHAAEHHYRAALALAGELDMRPLLGRAHLGIGRLYWRAGDRDTAHDHMLTATRLFIAMDMSRGLEQAIASLSELGNLLIVVPEHRNLYESLIRLVTAAGPIRVVMVEGDASVGEAERGKHVDEMLRSHGLSVIARD
jgi:class 3 adenylate cyclase/tetratricopeptide (TPR) repeat protein